MTELESHPENAFALQKQTLSPSHQPMQLYHLSHDLRGPLNSVLGFAELLLEGVEGPLNEMQMEDITAIRQSASGLLNLINSVVDLSKLEADRLPLTFKPVELALIVDKVVARAAIISDRVNLNPNLPAGISPVWGDSDRIEQMILNLVIFMIKMKGDGSISLSAQADEEQVTMQMTATNVSVAPEEVAELFELVVKVDPAGHTSLGRGGVILPLTYRLAQKHQGKLWVESFEESGTSFYLQLPLYQAQE